MPNFAASFITPHFKRMLHKTFILVWLCLCSLTSYAQRTGELFNQTIVQEKVYLHLDNNCYFAGDTIWYKAYVVRADDHRPTDMSRILYVELLNEQGYLVERQQLVVDYEGQANGQFALNDSAWAGYYEVRAYTKWMLNFGEDWMFSRVMPVYARNDSTADYRRKVMPVKVTAGDYTIEYPLPKCNIGLFPEGGHLVYGQESRVAFEVTNEQTKRIRVDGALLEDGKEILPVRCSDDGRGVFSFVPRRGSKYQVQFVVNGEAYHKDLQRIDETGYTLRVDKGRQSLHVTVRCTGDSLLARPANLAVSCRGRILQTEALRFDHEGRCEVAFDVDSLPAGVNTVTLYGEQPLASRMVFINKSADVTLKAATTGLPVKPRPYERMALDVSLGEAAANQTFSLSVRDKRQMDESYHTGNIMTELLLSSDLRGYIDRADRYFNDPDALDLLMMVQGWSRYDWAQMHDGDISRVLYSPEQNMMIYGQMTDLKSTIWQKAKGRKALFATLFLKDSLAYDKKLAEDTYLFKGSMYADEDGKFRINYSPFYGNAILQLNGFYTEKLEKKESYSKKIHDPHILIRCNYFFPEEAKQYSWYEMNRPDSLFDRYAMTAELDDSVSSSILLDDVTVKRKRLNFMRVQRDKPVASYDFLDFMNEQWDRGRYDDNFLFEFTQNHDFFNIFRKGSDYLTGRYEVEPGGITRVMFNAQIQDPYLAIDEIKRRRFSFIHRIGKIEFLTDSPRRPAYYQLRHKGEATQYGGVVYNNGYVNLIQLPDGNGRFLNGRYITLHGFNAPAEFYSPDYSQIPLPETPDVRHTLYWNPSVTTDAEGRAHVEFYNNGVCTDLNVEVEGVTKDGKFVVNF